MVYLLMLKMFSGLSLLNQMKDEMKNEMKKVTLRKGSNPLPPSFALKPAPPPNPPNPPGATTPAPTNTTQK